MKMAIKWLGYRCGAITQPGQKALYLSYTNGRFSGNYFELVNNTITTLSLDNTRKCVAPVTANRQVREYKIYENGVETLDNTGMATSISVPPAYIYSYNHNLYYLIQLLGLGQGGGSGGQPGGQEPVASYLEPPADGGSGGGGGIAYFSAPVIELINRLNLYYEQAIWLQSHPALADELLAYLQTATNPLAVTLGLGHLKRMMTDPGYLSFMEQYHIDHSNQPVWWENPNYLDPFGGVDFGDWAINYLLQYPVVGMASFEQQFMPSSFTPVFDYTNLDNPVFVNDDTLQMPIGFDFKFENFSSTTAPPIRIIGKVPSRKNSEDTTYGTNCDHSGILSNMPGFTDQQLFDEMKHLFHKTSVGILETVGDQMIARFRNSTGGSYTNNDLSQRVFESSAFQNFIIKFGNRLHIALKKANWNINSVDTIVMPQEQRPAFNGTYNKFTGLQILINDTEETIIELTGFSIHPVTHKWTANLNVIIKDHFGLDKNDALVYQDNHVGFAAWWILQHCRGYKPFETVVKFKMELVSD
jgi:hypothetical protein